MKTIIKSGLKRNLKTGGQPWLELGIFDPHVPYEDKRAVEALMHYVMWRKNTPGIVPVRGLTVGGDLIDFEAVSKHNKDKRQLQENLRLRDEFSAGRKFLFDWRCLLGPKAPMSLLEGNHEHRIATYIEKYPELDGLLDIPTLLDLDKLQVDWYPYWTHKTRNTLKIGKLIWGHGYKTGEYVAGLHVKAMHCNFIHGHTHNIQEVTLALAGKGKIITGISAPCMVDLDRPWTGGRPERWENGFVLVYYYPDGGFQHYIVRIHKGRFISPEGLVVTWKGVQE